MVDFINEVEEELRKDRYNALLRKWGPLIIVALVGIVALAGYLEWNKNRVSTESRAASISFVEAQEKGDAGNIDGAVADFIAIADKAPEGYKYLSYTQAAALELDRGNRARAVELFDKAAATKVLPRHEDLPKMKAAMIVFNDGDFAAVESRLQSLIPADRPYSYLARELLANTQLKLGNEQAAIAELRLLNRELDVPAGVKERVKQVLTLLNAQEAPAETTPAPGATPDDTTPPETLPQETIPEETTPEGAESQE